MWKVYLFEFIVTLVISIGWVYLIDKNMDNSNNDDIEFP
jgi:hypothetical protein